MIDNTKKYYFFSDAKYLKLDIPVPHEKMLIEAQALKHRFTDHRYSDGSHRGWKSLSLYGLGENKHESWQDYGYSSAIDAAKDFKWTDAALECPTIMEWLQNKFPCQRFGRVRLMLVEAGGWIGLHSDTKYRILENINISLSNPQGCVWRWGDGTDLFMEPGGVYAMNISYDHSVINNSDQDRYHLIVSRHDSTPDWMNLINDACKNMSVTGEYQLHEIAV
jgi:hypothetical protein